MMNGEITSTEAVFREHDPALFTIRGFDKLHRFSRGREQRTFEDVKDSDIASIIAGELGLGCDADDSGKLYDHVFQNNMSNIDFLYARARMINFEVDVTDSTLYFKKPRIASGGGPELVWQENLKRVRFYLSTAKQVNEVNVRGWCVKDKKEIVGKATNGMELSIMAGDKYGGQVAGGKFGKGNILTMVCNHPLQTQEEADAFAKARLNELAMNFLTGEATVEGNMDIKAGVVVTFKECGKKYDGQYYVVRAIHTLKPGSGPGTGYTTRFQFKRTGVNQV
jgi:phage protein D